MQHQDVALNTGSGHSGASFGGAARVTRIAPMMAKTAVEGLKAKAVAPKPVSLRMPASQKEIATTDRAGEPIQRTTTGAGGIRDESRGPLRPSGPALAHPETTPKRAIREGAQRKNEPLSNTSVL